MQIRRLCITGLSVLLLPLEADCAKAAPGDEFAARAVMEAKAMLPSRSRDVVSREASRNLRYADRDRAVEAAAAMSESDELRRATRLLIPRSANLQRRNDRWIPKLTSAQASSQD